MKILEIAHITETPGPVQYLARYFEERNAQIYKIYHPLEGSRIAEPAFFLGEEKLDARHKMKNMLLGYFRDFFLSLKWIAKSEGKIDKAVGMNCFDVLPLIIYAFFRPKKIGAVIFFNTDFSRRRFDNRILNRVYVAVDRFGAEHADKICCNTRRVIKKRIEEGIDPEKIIYTPNGIFFEDLANKSPAKKGFEKKLLYVGSLTREHGLFEIINALKDVRLELEIIGTGSCEAQIKSEVARSGLEDRVRFFGHWEHGRVLKYLSGFSGFGFAPYSAEKDWTRYCDPVKVKEYLACGVPVIVSDVPEIAERIADKEAGFVFENEDDLRSIFARIDDLGMAQYEKMAKGAEGIGSEFDLRRIYSRI